MRGVPGGGRGAEAGGRDASGEAHELGALMVAACAAAEGWGITYLGPDLPVAELLAAVRDTGARAVALSIVYSSDDEEFLAAIKATRVGLPKGTPLLVGGAAASQLREAHWNHSAPSYWTRCPSCEPGSESWERRSEPQ